MSGGGSSVSGSGAAAAALRAAASTGDAAACQRYLGSSRCVRYSRDEFGRSALHLAATAGYGEVLRVLLNVAAPKEIDAPDGGGCTPLQRAAAEGHEDIVKILLARGAEVNKEDSVHGNSALHEASWKGFSRIIRILATAGAPLSRPNVGGFTPLHLCCQNGHNQSCRELLLAGCDADLKNNYGDTALHTSARYGHAGVTRIVISAQCKVSEQNKNGDTALHIAAAMGRRKLTRILLEAGCDKNLRNKQGETARDIGMRKELNEILVILDECSAVFAKKDKQLRISKKKSKNRGKVKFDTTVVEEKPKHWSPYGCHYYPDPEAFPSPRLDSLPNEPLKRGEQYYLDLGGNICKGPVGVGYTCYCAPLFRHLESRLDKDKKELQKAQLRLGQRVAGLEQKLSRGVHGRRSERIDINNRQGLREPTLPRCKSLEMLDCLEDNPIQTTRSMDELDVEDEEDPASRPSVKELVARIQSSSKQYDSESSEDENAVRMSPQKGTMGNSNLSVPINDVRNYENMNVDIPRSRSGVYSPDVSPPPNIRKSTDPKFTSSYSTNLQNQMRYQPQHVMRQSKDMRNADIKNRNQFYNSDEFQYDQHIKYANAPKFIDLNSRFAKLRVLDNKSVIEGPSTSKIFENPKRILENTHDNVDRDTNNDSGYSTKVYGSSKGNSPSLSGQMEGECLGTSSLV